MTEKQSAKPTAPPPKAAGASRLSAGTMTRRQMIRGSMFGTIGLLCTQALVGAGVMFWPAKVSGFGGKVTVPVDVKSMKPTDPPFKYREGKVFISRLDDSVMALYWKCVHLGCTVPWNGSEERFHCPCHASIYDRTGQNVGGPAPRPLDYMEIVEIGPDSLTIDTGKIVMRERHAQEHETPVG